MRCNEMKKNLIALFDANKLTAMPNEWGFFNEFDHEIKKIGFTVNLVPDTIIEAHNRNVDYLITHHPMIFKMKIKCEELLKEYNISHAFFHAPLDDAIFGNSHSMANNLGLINCKKAISYENGYYWGVIGEYPEMIPFEELQKRLSNIVNEPLKVYKNNTKLVRKVCINTGGGDAIDKLEEAIENDCDVYITGGYNLDFLLYAKYMKISLLIGSHTYTEQLGISNVAILLALNTKIDTTIIKEMNY